MSRRKKAWSFGILAAAGLLLIALFGAIAVLQTVWFKNQVRARIMSVAETATGGRVEIASFHWHPFDLAAEADGLVIDPPAPDQLHGARIATYNDHRMAMSFAPRRSQK